MKRRTADAALQPFGFVELLALRGALRAGKPLRAVNVTDLGLRWPVHGGGVLADLAARGVDVQALAGSPVIREHGWPAGWGQGGNGSTGGRVSP